MHMVISCTGGYVKNLEEDGGISTFFSLKWVAKAAPGSSDADFCLQIPAWIPTDQGHLW